MIGEVVLIKVVGVGYDGVLKGFGVVECEVCEYEVLVFGVLFGWVAVVYGWYVVFEDQGLIDDY